MFPETAPLTIGLIPLLLLALAVLVRPHGEPAARHAP
jgi:hypothetical protein